MSVAEEVDELCLQRLGHSMRVDVYVEVAQLDEKLEADVPVETLDDALSKEICSMMSLRCGRVE